MNTIQEAYEDLLKLLTDRSKIQCIGIGDTGNPKTSFISIHFYKKPLFKYPTTHMGYEVKHHHNSAFFVGHP